MSMLLVTRFGPYEEVENRVLISHGHWGRKAKDLDTELKGLRKCIEQKPGEAGISGISLNIFLGHQQLCCRVNAQNSYK